METVKHQVLTEGLPEWADIPSARAKEFADAGHKVRELVVRDDAASERDVLIAALLKAESALHSRLPHSTAMREVLAALKSVGIEPQHKTGTLPGTL